MDLKRMSRTRWSVPLLLAAVLAPYGSTVPLPTDPRALPVVDGTLFPMVPHLVPGGAVPVLHPGADARGGLLAPLWPWLAGRPLWGVGVLAVLLLGLALRLLPREGAGRRAGAARAGRLAVASVAWAAALVLVPAWVAALPGLSRLRRHRAAAAGGLLLAVLFGLGAGQWSGLAAGTGRGDDGVATSTVDSTSETCRAWLVGWLRRSMPWGPLLRRQSPSRVGTVLATTARDLPAVRELRAAATWSLLAAGAGDEAAVSLELWRRTWPDDREGRLAEAWRLLMTGNAGAALRRFATAGATYPVAAAAGRICALRALGRETEAADLAAAWRFPVPPPGNGDQAPGR